MKREVRPVPITTEEAKDIEHYLKLLSIRYSREDHVTFTCQTILEYPLAEEPKDLEQEVWDYIDKLNQKFLGLSSPRRSDTLDWEKQMRNLKGIMSSIILRKVKPGMFK